MKRFALTSLLLVLAAPACYHATVETGLAPSPQTVEKAFAPAWIDGLVPPSTVSTAAQCHTGVAKVETQLSFVNMLVGAITLGIFTPMDIKVTCAAAHAALPDPRSREFAARSDASPAVLEAVLAAAIVASERTGTPSLIRFVPTEPATH
jgi:hypothetical protein